MTGAEFYLRQLMRRVEVDCLNGRGQMMRARTIREVKRAADVAIPPLVRPLLHTMAEYKSLQAYGEERAAQIVREQLQVLKHVDKADLERVVSEFRRNVLGELRGEYAAQYRMAERDLALVLARRASPLNPD
jgi:hypothetical protein